MNADESNGLVLLGGKEGSVRKVGVDSKQLDYLSEFKSFGFVLGESGTD